MTNADGKRFLLKLCGLLLLELIGTYFILHETDEWMAKNYGTTFHITCEVVKGEKK